MFTKHVWYDRKHQAEVFITDEGVISGTIVAYQGAVSIVNPRQEILAALYQEAKIKRILSLRTVILTDNTIEFARGLCSLLNYSRGLRRKTPLTVITRDDSRVAREFITSCCSPVVGGSSFEVNVVALKIGEQYELGIGTIGFINDGEQRNPLLVVKTGERTLHYLDESHNGAPDESQVISSERPNVVIRAAELPKYAEQTRHMLTVLA
jgi:hypothetical protein